MITVVMVYSVIGESKEANLQSEHNFIKQYFVLHRLKSRIMKSLITVASWKIQQINSHIA